MIENNKQTNTSKILLVALGHFVHDIFTSFFATILAVLKTSMHLSYTQISLLPVAIRATSILNPFIGTLADHWGLKYFFILSPGLTAIAMSSIGISKSYYVILLLLILTGLSNSCFHVSTPVILKRLSKNRVGLSMSFFQIGGEAARTLGPVIIVPVITYWSLKGTIRLIPLGVLTSFILYLVFKNFPLPPALKKEEEKEKHPFLYTLKNNIPFWVSLSIVMLIKTLNSSIIANYLPIYLKESGKNLWVAGGALTWIQFFATTGVFVTGYLADKYSPSKIITLLSILTPFSTLAIFYTHGYLFILALALNGLIAFTTTPVILALIQNYGFKYPSIANGTYMATSFFFTSFILLLIGYLADIYTLKKVMVIACWFSLLGIPLLFFFPLKNKKD
jgi:FSR family fosmidomycin resistance protein-like MFS transporter